MIKYYNNIVLYLKCILQQKTKKKICIWNNEISLLLNKKIHILLVFVVILLICEGSGDIAFAGTNEIYTTVGNGLVEYATDAADDVPGLVVYLEPVEHRGIRITNSSIFYKYFLIKFSMFYRWL